MRIYSLAVLDIRVYNGSPSNITSEGSRGWWDSLTFPAPRGFLHCLAHGPTSLHTLLPSPSLSLTFLHPPGFISTLVFTLSQPGSRVIFVFQDPYFNEIWELFLYKITYSEIVGTRILGGWGEHYSLPQMTAGSITSIPQQLLDQESKMGQSALPSKYLAWLWRQHWW